MVEHDDRPLIPSEVVSQLGNRKSVRIALIKDFAEDPKVLLTTEQKGIVYHSLPGGKVDPNEYGQDISINDVFAAALARELYEELGLPQEQFSEHIRNLVNYFDFVVLTKFNQNHPLSEVVFYGLLPNEILDKLDLGGQVDTKIINYNWFSLKEVLENYKIEEQGQIPPEGVYIFVDSHIPVILEKLSEKLSGGETEPKDQKTIAVDFDGVIHRYSKGWLDGTIYDDPVEGSKSVLERLVEKGYKIVIFTTRVNPEMGDDVEVERKKMEDWLNSHKFNEGTHYHQITALKPKAIAYIDDQAIRFTSWEDISKLLLNSTQDISEA